VGGAARIPTFVRLLTYQKGMLVADLNWLDIFDLRSGLAVRRTAVHGDIALQHHRRVEPEFGHAVATVGMDGSCEGVLASLGSRAIAEEDEKIQIRENAFHSRHGGEVLHKKREPMEVLESIKGQLGCASAPNRDPFRFSPIPLISCANLRSGGVPIGADWDPAPTVLSI
jgi:hypothetical protein